MPWQIDSVHSFIQFSVRHLMISTARGRFEKFSGSVDFDENDPTTGTVDIHIDVASINTNEAQRDAHLRSPDFFEVDKYPTMTFKSKRIEKIGDRHGRIIGDLTIKDITKEVVLEAEYAGTVKTPFGTTSAGASATAKISRKEWGLTWNMALEAGGVAVSDEVKIEIELELVKQEQPALVMA
ncbi:MAG TPA: YceI family protein [Anaerolineae bacterium]|nr:YceI family protein [Anaerolineae bacterium]